MDSIQVFSNSISASNISKQVEPHTQMDLFLNIMTLEETFRLQHLMSLDVLLCGWLEETLTQYSETARMPKGFKTVYYFNSLFLGLNKNLRDEKFRTEILGDSFSVLNQDIMD